MQNETKAERPAGPWLQAFQQTRGVLERGIAFPAEHAGDFFLARFSFHFLEPREGATASHFLRDHKMRARRRSDLRQMRDAKHLMIGREFPHLFTDSVRN